MPEFCYDRDMRGCPLPPFPTSLDETWSCRACGRLWHAVDPVKHVPERARKKTGLGWRGESKIAYEKRQRLARAALDNDIEFCGEEQNWHLDRYTTPEQWREVWGRLTPSDRAQLITLARLILGAAAERSEV